MLPGDSLTLSLSKTRPVVNAFKNISYGPPEEIYGLDGIFLSGSHNTVILNTGSIEMTIYGSYVREGEEYNP
jgi:hypothetical protein